MKCRKTKREEKNEDKTISNDEVEAVGGGFKCPNPNCAMYYITQGYLDHHIATGKHFYGSSNVSHTSKSKRLKKSISGLHYLKKLLKKRSMIQSSNVSKKSKKV